jgi:predicted nucleic acid-binding protein
MPFAVSAPALPAVVLDTNAVLDWLVFRDCSMLLLGAAIEGGAVLWLACPRMREELAHTLDNKTLGGRRVDSRPVLASFDRWSNSRAATPRSGSPAVVCTDPDDQIFIDFALSQRARWLVTRDGALLGLARRARVAGTLVLEPAKWRLE